MAEKNTDQLDLFSQGLYIIAIALFLIVGYMFEIFYLSWLFLPIARAVILIKKSSNN